MSDLCFEDAASHMESSTKRRAQLGWLERVQEEEVRTWTFTGSGWEKENASNVDK